MWISINLSDNKIHPLLKVFWQRIEQWKVPFHIVILGSVYTGLLAKVLKVHSHQEEVNTKISFDDCRPFSDLFYLFFDLFRVLFRLIWMGP